METLMALMPIILMIRPHQKRQKEVRAMQDSLQKGDKVITIGGFHGVIHSLDEATVVIQAGDGTKLTYDRSAIREKVVD